MKKPTPICQRPYTAYILLCVDFFTGEGKIRTKNKKWIVNAGMKAFNYGQGVAVSSGIYRSNQSGGYIN